MSLSASACAFSGLAKVFVCVWPAVPTLPNVPVNDSPVTSIDQNLCDFASLYWNVRIGGSVVCRLVVSRTDFVWSVGRWDRRPAGPEPGPDQRDAGPTGLSPAGHSQSSS